MSSSSSLSSFRRTLSWSELSEAANNLPSLVPVRIRRTASTNTVPIETSLTSTAQSAEVAALNQPLPSLVFIKRGAKSLIEYLPLNKEQRKAVDSVYSESRDLMLEFSLNNPEDQSRAQAKLRELGLERHTRTNLEARWKKQWSDGWNSNDKRQRTLFQCSCGYDDQVRYQREEAKKEQRGLPANSPSKKWERRAPYPFTGCLAHIEVVERVDDGHVSRISGWDKHNEGCLQAVLCRIPPIPLHEHVYEVALEQLMNGASLTSIQERNQKMYANKEYRDMSVQPEIANTRYILLHQDHQTLYAKMTRKLGVDTRQQPQYNLDEWLNPGSPHFKPAIQEAIFHYAARASSGERLEVCIATKDMDQAAYKYAHRSQLVLDGTFGVCSSRLLLFIALAVDNNKKGLPIAFFLFSAPAGNRATHAGYNTEILQKLLRNWRLHLEKKYGLFEPHSVITDTDTKERGALISVWPSIVLLICKFHLRQCWKNYRNQVIKGNADEQFKVYVVTEISALELRLIETVEHFAAIELIREARTKFLKTISDNPGNTLAKAAAEGGLKHLNYLDSVWMSLQMWRSWSEWGRVTVAALIGIPVEGVIPTTNHLESFNGILKRCYIRSWLRSGHRLRFDLLIFLLISRILPDVFRRHTARQEYATWLTNRFRKFANGQNLLELRNNNQNVQTSRGPSSCLWTIDESWQLQAIEILKLQQLIIKNGPDSTSFAAQCTSSRSHSVHYDLSLHQSGAASCTCLDFQKRKVACKHLRAFRIAVDISVLAYHARPFNYPSTLAEAEQLGLEPSGGNTDQVQDLTAPRLPPDAGPTTDWSAIQALGGDQTILGAGFDVEDELESEDMPVAESAEILPFPELKGPTWTRDQAAAVTQQVHLRIEQELTHLLPRLHGIENHFSDLSTLPTTPQTQEFIELLDRLSSRCTVLQQATTQSSVHPVQPNPPSLTTFKTASLRLSNLPATFSTIPQKRRLLAPSPERGQKRKDSKSTL